MNKVLVVAVAAMMILVGTFAWHEYNSPTLPRYNLNIGLNNTEIQNVTINNYAYHNIHSDWFNVTMTGYGNYTILFPYYVAYDGRINNTAQVYLAHNTTILFGIPNITLRITTLDPNSSLVFQQMIHLNRTTFPFINKAFSNIAFFYINGTPIYAWLQSITNNNATLWLKLNGSVNRTINIKIYGPTANEMNAKGYYGEAPQLSATYGQYDNGRNVFSLYDNFSSALEMSKYGWSGQNYNLSNGLVWNVPIGDRFYIVSNTIIPINNATIAEECVTSTLWDMDFTISSGNSANDWNGHSITSLAQPRVYGSVYGNNGLYGNSVNMSDGFIVLGYNVGVGIAYVNGIVWATISGGLSGSNAKWYFSTGASAAYNGHIHWVRTRARPPNDVMPSSSSSLNFGPIYVGG